MNMYDPTHSLQCEFFSCKTENIRRAAAALVVISSSAQYLTGSVLWKHKQENSFRVALGIILTPLILLPEKFLQFDWLRADVFQLNLKYLHVKITVTMVTQITK